MSRCMFYAISSQTENEKETIFFKSKKELSYTTILPVYIYKKNFSGTTILFLLICTGVFYGVPTLQNDKNIGFYIYTQFFFYSFFHQFWCSIYNTSLLFSCSYLKDGESLKKLKYIWIVVFFFGSEGLRWIEQGSTRKRK